MPEHKTAFRRTRVQGLRPHPRAACLGIRFSVGCALIIPMIIQTILLDPSRAVWSDSTSNVSRLDPSGADQADADHPTRNRKVDGSNPAPGSKTAGRSTCAVVSPLACLSP